MPMYFESRNQPDRGVGSIAADVMRHLHTRQHLGKVVVVCEHPVPVLSAARKQWLKLSRGIQKRRASTLNADKILKYTHAITRMQHMHFSAKSPLIHPDAEVYFLRPSELAVLPAQCRTTYILCTLKKAEAEQLLHWLPNDALLVDYHSHAFWAELDCQPKRLLEAQVRAEWEQLDQFLRHYQIDINRLAQKDMSDIDAIDNALDVLLSISYKFLQVATAFHHTLELARPLRLTKAQRQAYDLFALLAHRVQALSPGAFTQRFLETYGEDDAFFLYDVGQTWRVIAYEGLPEIVTRHLRAGRARLAQALIHKANLMWSSKATPAYADATNQ